MGKKKAPAPLTSEQILAAQQNISGLQQSAAQQKIAYEKLKTDLQPQIDALKGTGGPGGIFANLGQIVGLQSKITQAEQAYKNTQVDALANQLKLQSQGYGYSWKVNKKNEDWHTKNLAKILVDKGLTDLKDAGYDDKGNLINKATGQVVPWRVNSKGKTDLNKLHVEGSGAGKTDYMVQKDAQGNPVFTPKWHDLSPSGLGGFLIDVAAPVVGIATGNPWLAAATAGGITAAKGGDIFDIVKSAGINYLGGKIGDFAANQAVGALPMVGGSATLTNALADAIGGMAQAGATGALSGNLSLDQILKSGLASGVTSGIQGSIGGTNITGNPIVDKALVNTAAGTAANIATGRKDLMSPLISNAAGVAGQQVASALPSTGSSWADRFSRSLAQNAVGQLTAQELAQITSQPAPRPTFQQPTPQAQTSQTMQAANQSVLDKLLSQSAQTLPQYLNRG